ncbi:MAG: glycoside hydrolase family 97 protein [Alphaproteobacteria bacterium]|nr:glycoside hydrolase family 97 protein [Alphaproteobacteria bacterium]
MKLVIGNLAARIAALCVLVCAPFSAAADVTVASPDGAVVVTLSDAGGEANYSVTFHGESVVGRSRLGMLFKDREGFDRDLRLVSARKASSDTTWEQPWGERRYVRNRYNETLVEFASVNGPSRRMNVRVRAYDDGVGFRYEIPKQKNIGKVNIIDELTEFALPHGSTAWWIPARSWNRYEYLYKTTDISEIIEAHTPMTLRAPTGMHMSIHEAALVNYSGMALKQSAADRFKADLAPWDDGILVKTQTPFVTPWRTIEISKNAVGLLNSDLILNLNEPNKLGDVSWFKPGKYVGIWWAMHIRDRTWGHEGIHGATTAEAKRYIDFAAKYGFDGVLVEGWNVGWDGDWFDNGDLFNFTKAFPDYDLKAVTDYACKKGVRIIGHNETSGAVTNYEKQMGAAFDLYKRLGIRMVKTGYVANGGQIERIDQKGIRRYEYHDGQFMVGHYLRVVQEAAKRYISIDTHEPVKDTGLRRTYPNWVSREGARGQEYNAWGVPPNPPEHVAILPFTRMLSGPMDYTPGIFDLEPNKRPPARSDMPRNDPRSRVESTLAQQLALYVVLYSPIQMAADLPENYEKRPKAFQFILDVPTDWSESRALNGEVGDFVTIARKARHGEDWYVGAITDENARTLKAPLDFLDAGRIYKAEIYRDGPKADWKTNPYDIVIENREVRSTDTLVLPLGPGGGAAIRFTPANGK